MRNTTLTLIATGLMLLGIVGWLSWVLPLRKQERGFVINDSMQSSVVDHINLWGVRVSLEISNRTFNEKGTIKEELESGPANSSGRHGRWRVRNRLGNGEWNETVAFYFEGRQVSEAEWHRLCGAR